MTLNAKPKRKILPPNRALLIELGSRKFTATWCLDDLGWRCWYPSKLAWLRKITPAAAKQELKRRGFTFSWIVPNVGTPIKPPF